MEHELDQWIQLQRGRGVCLISFTIKVKAAEFLREYCKKNNVDIDFRASAGWFFNFLNRKRYSFRRITTAGLTIINLSV